MKRTKKQETILNVAIHLFREKGYLGTSMRDLAAGLDIKAASLYAHLRSKDELLEWICFDLADRFFAGLQEVTKSKLLPNQKLELFIEKHLTTVLENPDITHIYSNEWKHLDTSLDHFIELRKKYQKEVENLFENLFDEMGQPMDSKRFTVRFVLHTLNNSYFWYQPHEKPLEEMVQEIKEKVLYGLIGR